VVERAKNSVAGAMAGRVSTGRSFQRVSYRDGLEQEDPTTSRDDIIDIARSLVPPAR
jgi:hypothetical protein